MTFLREQTLLHEPQVILCGLESDFRQDCWGALCTERTVCVEHGLGGIERRLRGASDLFEQVHIARVLPLLHQVEGPLAI